MGYLTQEQILNMGFKAVGVGCKISDKATFYRIERISLGDFVQIDDFAVIANWVILKDYAFIGLGSRIFGTTDAPVILEPFACVSYDCFIMASSDDYSGRVMCGSMIPYSFRDLIQKEVRLGRQSIIGAKSVIMPGSIIGEGSAIGAMSFVKGEVEPFGIYAGNPLRFIKKRKKDMLLLEKEFLEQHTNTHTPTHTHQHTHKILCFICGVIMGATIIYIFKLF